MRGIRDSSRSLVPLPGRIHAAPRAAGTGIVLIFVQIPSLYTAWSLAGLAIFGLYTVVDFNRLRRAGADEAVPLAAGIFLDVLNIFRLLAPVRALVLTLRAVSSAFTRKQKRSSVDPRKLGCEGCRHIGGWPGRASAYSSDREVSVAPMDSFPPDVRQRHRDRGRVPAPRRRNSRRTERPNTVQSDDLGPGAQVKAPTSPPTRSTERISSTTASPGATSTSPPSKGLCVGGCWTSTWLRLAPRVLPSRSRRSAPTSSAVPASTTGVPSVSAST